ncbi:unnamed protein product [Ilex paraguariensis]|uniref:Uncharacterized protein n=1 Tax=Ilex paraguariensis TaxID=185542 RepID=A0ABC8V581_9AQUA
MLRTNYIPHIPKAIPMAANRGYTSSVSHRLRVDEAMGCWLFVANENKPLDIVNVLVAKRSKLLRLLGVFKADTEDQSFEVDKAKVVKEIAELEPQPPVNVSRELYKDLVI